MNNPHDPEANDATDGEGSISLSQKISSEWPICCCCGYGEQGR